MPPVLIDTDPGVDDALALLQAWGTPSLSVDVITTVAGNVPVTAGTRNVFRLLALRDPRPVPVVGQGAATPLARPLVTATRHHGEDGLGDLDDWPPAHPTLAPAGGVALMVAAARRHGSDLTLIALGPLTNVAHAVEADVAAMRGVGRVVVMGGAVDVAGNVTADAEFNMHVDPEAARRVVEAGLRLDLVPLDATRQAVLEAGALDAALTATPASYAERVRRFTAYSFGTGATRRMTLHDPLAVGLAADPSLGTWEAIRVAIGADGETRRVAGSPNVRVARRVDSVRFMQTFLAALCRVSS
ncbi:MAG TPA: nucleoside hydrolase [Methylomirabilota bacterium]|nr:nucleoside hydrolase [Methylomirabilota bacterium]